MCTYILFPFREVTTAFLFCARACITGAGQLLFLYTAEVYPTQVRGLGLGMATAFGSMGGIITPYIAQVRMYRVAISDNTACSMMHVAASVHGSALTY